jgi:hypothetical protein
VHGGRAMKPLIVLALLMFAVATRAADHVPPPPQRTPLLITNAVLHPVVGPVIEGGRMLVERGRIVALAGPGQAMPTPSATPQVLDLGGRHVYPGFISANSALGLVEVSAVRATLDVQEQGAINPNARAVVAVNADSELLPVARSNGVLAALVVPQGAPGGGFAGISALMQMDGWTWEQMALKTELGVHLALPSMRLNAASAHNVCARLTRPWTPLRRMAVPVPPTPRSRPMHAGTRCCPCCVASARCLCRPMNCRKFATPWLWQNGMASSW